MRLTIIGVVLFVLGWALGVGALFASEGAMFAVVGAAGYLVAVGGLETLRRGLGRPERVRAGWLLMLALLLVPALVFLFLLTGSSGPAWSYAVLALLGFVFLATAAGVLASVRR